MAANSFGLSFIDNFRIIVTDGTTAVSGITGSVTIQGNLYNFTTDANGYSQWFYVIPSGNLFISGNIPQQNTFAEKAISHTFIAPNQQIEIQLDSFIDFKYSPVQPIRIIDPKTGDHVGYENLLFSNINIGTRGQINQCKSHKRLRSRSEDITIFTTSSSNILKIINSTTGVQIGSSIAMTSIGTDLYNTTFNWESLGISEGTYFLQIEMTIGATTKTAQSEPLDVRDSWPNCLLIEYTNFDNTKNLIFERVPNPEYYMLISADLLPADDSQDTTLFLDDENTGTLLHDEVLDIWRLSTLSPHPFYEIKTLQIALGLDDVKINGEEFIKRGQGSREIFGAYGLLLNYSVEVQRKQFDAINYFDRSTAFTS